MSAVSEVQIAANLANALLSTGPRTELGKQRSSQNAVRHAIFAKTIPEADQEAYLRLLVKFQQDFEPKGIIEDQLVETLASAHCRLARCRELQDALLFADTETPDHQLDALNKYSLYEHRLTRIVQTNLKQLREIQAERHIREERDLKDAAEVSKSMKARNLPYDPAQDGFVFSAAELDQWILRSDRIFSAKNENFGVRFFAKPTTLSAF